MNAKDYASGCCLNPILADIRMGYFCMKKDEVWMVSIVMLVEVCLCNDSSLLIQKHVCIFI